MKDRIRSGGAMALALGGVGAAFSLAACCALPMLLLGAGLSPYWVVPAGEFGTRFGFALHLFAVAALLGAAFLVLRAPGSCAPGALCAKPWFRIGIIALALLGVALLVLARIYR